jgi:hypothetical protein
MFLVHDTKTGSNVSNEHKMYQVIIIYPNIFQMAIEYINIFQSMVLQNLPKFENQPSGNPALKLSSIRLG